ncbi:MAG: hypothetical protein PHI23_04410 [Candidatus Peribacteraceae bacterium]|nr:hypothetical protein [Candidatus Peribacteraceae bacterium]
MKETECELCGEPICQECGGCGCDENPCTCDLMADDDDDER